MRIPSWLSAAVVFVVVTGIGVPVWFEIVILLFPNRTSEGHLVMPMGQAAVALIAAPVTGLLCAARFRRALLS